MDNIGLVQVKDGEEPMLTHVKSSTEIYQGFPIPGALENQSKWAIKKIFQDTGVWKIYWANGSDEKNQKWSSRESLTYNLLQ